MYFAITLTPEQKSDLVVMVQANLDNLKIIDSPHPAWDALGSKLLGKEQAYLAKTYKVILDDYGKEPDAVWFVNMLGNGTCELLIISATGKSTPYVI